MHIHNYVHLRNYLCKAIAKIIPFMNDICRMTIAECGGHSFVPVYVPNIHSIAEKALDAAKRADKFASDQDKQLTEFTYTLDESLAVIDMFDNLSCENPEAIDVRTILDTDKLQNDIDACLMACCLVDAKFGVNSIMSTHFNWILENVMTVIVEIVKRALNVLDKNVDVETMFAGMGYRDYCEGHSFIFVMHDKQINFNKEELVEQAKEAKRKKDTEEAERVMRERLTYIETFLMDFLTLCSGAHIKFAVSQVSRNVLEEVEKELIGEKNFVVGYEAARHARRALDSLRTIEYASYGAEWSKAFFESLCKPEPIYCKVNDATSGSCSLTDMWILLSFLDKCIPGVISAIDMSTMEHISTISPDRPSVSLLISLSPAR